MSIKNLLNIFQYWGQDSKKILSAKTMSYYFRTSKRKCQGFLYKNKNFIKANGNIVATGIKQASLWKINNIK